MARAGDREAQYYVYAALEFCDVEFRALFRRRKSTGWLTRDEGVIRAASSRIQPSGYAEEVDQKCRALMEGGRPELGESEIWLDKSTSQGQPIAMAVTADALLITPRPDERSQATRERAKDALMEALESKDPEVIWRIGELQGVLNNMSDESTKSQWAWWLVACERGFDCGPDSPWRRWSCLYDQLCRPDETMIDYARRLLQSDFPEVEELAREINANIDAERWSDIDIGG